MSFNIINRLSIRKTWTFCTDLVTYLRMSSYRTIESNTFALWERRQQSTPYPDSLTYWPIQCY